MKNIPEALQSLLISLACAAEHSVKQNKIDLLSDKAAIVAETARFLRFILQKKKNATSVRKNLEKLLENLNLDDDMKQGSLALWDENIAYPYVEYLNSGDWVQDDRIDELVGELCKLFIAFEGDEEKIVAKEDEELYDGTHSKGSESVLSKDNEENTYDEEEKESDSEGVGRKIDLEDLLSSKSSPASFSRKTQIYATDNTEEAAEWLKSIMEDHKDAKRLVGIAWKIDPKLPLKTQLPSLEEVLAIKDDQEHALGITEECSDNKILLRLVDGTKCDDDAPDFMLTQEMFVDLEKAMKSDEPFQEDSTYIYLFDTNDKLREDFDLRSDLRQCASPYWLDNLSAYSSDDEKDE